MKCVRLMLPFDDFFKLQNCPDVGKLFFLLFKSQGEFPRLIITFLNLNFVWECELCLVALKLPPLDGKNYISSRLCHVVSISFLTRNYTIVSNYTVGIFLIINSLNKYLIKHGVFCQSFVFSSFHSFDRHCWSITH